MIFCESLFGITTSRLLAFRLSCRITLYGLPSPMEAIWASKIKIIHLRWWLSVKFMTGLAGSCFFDCCFYIACVCFVFRCHF